MERRGITEVVATIKEVGGEIRRLGERKSGSTAAAGDNSVSYHSPKTRRGTRGGSGDSRAKRKFPRIASCFPDRAARSFHRPVPYVRPFSNTHRTELADSVPRSSVSPLIETKAEEMVEVLLESSAQEVAVAGSENGCQIETPGDRAVEERRGVVENTDHLTPIQKFYHGQSVFITGGTGFLGKLLIEKLLRGCPGIAFIYLLVRPKKGKDVEQRIEEIFDDPLFSKLKEERPKFRHQIVVVPGDCSEPDLGISAKDRLTIVQKVSIVFHVAATVRFDEKMKLAVAINVRSPRDAINLCKEMPQLKAFIHVSTAYANCPYDPIEEKFYEPPMDADKVIALMDCMDEKLADDITSRLLDKWPNTYTYTKAVAENVVKKQAGNLPVGIFRPAIVISTYQEPISGWIDNLYGPTGVAAGAGTGILRSIHCDGSAHANVVPGDMTVNALIASAWDVWNVKRSKTNENECNTEDDIPIYNYVSQDNPITYDQLKELSSKHGMKIPTCRAIWYYSFRNNKYRLVHLFYVYFFHLLPALLIDAVTVCIGKQPRLLKVYKKIHKFMDVLNYFTIQQWQFENNAVKALINKMAAADQKNFFCDIKELDWDTFFSTYIRGIRVYLIKDPMDTLPEARVKWQRLYWFHQALKLILAYTFLRIIWAVIGVLLQLFGRV